MNGVVQEGLLLKLLDDSREHAVEIIIPGRLPPPHNRKNDQ
ncbi:hypothetical protein [Quatrionicoccus australiensis]|nr:hypothetical protein [Quatrionicoccus australiensis]